MKSVAFLNGQFLPEEEANVPLATHALHYGTGCFEGIRGYWNDSLKKIIIFRLDAHNERLKNSCQTLGIKLDYDLAEIVPELVKKNALIEDIYIRPLAYKAGRAVTGFDLDKLPDGFGVFIMPMGKTLASTGINVIISSWLRQDARMIPPQAKPTGIYLNTSLAKTEAHRKSADDAILLNIDGSVAEASAANIFLVKNHKLITPSLDQNILNGITRQTIIELAQKEFSLETTERKVLKSELFSADEIFLTGTGVEIVPVLSIDNKPIAIGKVGSVSQKTQNFYFQIVHGQIPKYQKWLTAI